MKISKIRNVKTPTRGTTGSAGIDFYVPEAARQSIRAHFKLCKGCWLQKMPEFSGNATPRNG